MISYHYYVAFSAIFYVYIFYASMITC